MNRSQIEASLEGIDLLEDVTPQQLATEAKLGWLKRILFIAVWNLIKPYLARKLGVKVADVLEGILEGI